MTLRMTVLWGDEHTDLGEVAVAELLPNAALALSRGKFPKGYPHLDPNEDAVLAATNGPAWMLAVADGHNGFDAARGAMATLQSSAAQTLKRAGSDPEAAITSVFTAAHRAVVAAVEYPGGPRANSATTLAVGLITGDELLVGSFGDSMMAVVRAGRLRPINRTSPFLDVGTEPADLQVSRQTLEPGDVVFAATDGLTDFLGRYGRRSLGRTLGGNQSPGTLARLAVERAFAGGAGDNVAVALVAPVPPDA